MGKIQTEIYLPTKQHLNAAFSGLWLSGNEPNGIKEDASSISGLTQWVKDQELT